MLCSSLYLTADLRNMTIKEITIYSPIEEKIKWAEDCYLAERDLFLKDKRVRELMRKYEHEVGASRNEMERVGVVKACKECDRKDGGSCCGAGIEKRYSSVVLLINLLLDRKIPKERSNPKTCFFLGQSGCMLLAREVICVNYLCKKISECIEPERIASLREREGIELESLFRLVERLRKVMRA